MHMIRIAVLDASHLYHYCILSNTVTKGPVHSADNMGNEQVCCELVTCLGTQLNKCEQP